VLPRLLDHERVGDPWLSRGQRGIDGEHHCQKASFPVVGGYIVGARKLRLSLEVAAHCSTKLGAEMVVTARAQLDVNVKIDGERILK
jgi:hypothetical protein